jgi:TRAP-type C4-dicarboxylate transport system substrate-binding protein
MCNSKRPIESPADVKGLKIRVPPENQSRTSMEALGATAQVVPFPEVYLALANKVIDGAEQPLSAIYSQKWYEVQNYVSLTNHIYGNQFLIANGKVWQRIKPEWQKIIEEESRKAGKVARQLVTDQERDYIAAMQKIGVKVNSPNLAPFRAAMGPAHASLKSWIGAETWDKWMGFVEQARKKA